MKWPKLTLKTFLFGSKAILFLVYHIVSIYAAYVCLEANQG